MVSERTIARAVAPARARDPKFVTGDWVVLRSSEGPPMLVIGHDHATGGLSCGWARIQGDYRSVDRGVFFPSVLSYWGN